MADRTTKALLFAIALGLWMNVVGEWVRPVVLLAQDSEIASYVSRINRMVTAIADGNCVNDKIC